VEIEMLKEEYERIKRLVQNSMDDLGKKIAVEISAIRQEIKALKELGAEKKAPRSYKKADDD
jgi:hypothetical protein